MLAARSRVVTNSFASRVHAVIYCRRHDAVSRHERAYVTPPSFRRHAVICRGLIYEKSLIFAIEVVACRL